MYYTVDATHLQQQHCNIFPHSRRIDQVLMCTFVSLVRIREINWILVPGFLKRLLFNKSKLRNIKFLMLFYKWLICDRINY